jgi:KilA-N domain
MENLLRTWNGRTIRQREDGYLSLTDMAQSCGKQIGHWNDLKSTKSYLTTLSVTIGIPIVELIESQEGKFGGSWGHSKVAIRFAQWCSDEFAIQVDTWIEELLTKGKVQFDSVKQQKQFDPSERIDSYLTKAERYRDLLGSLSLSVEQYFKDAIDSVLAEVNEKYNNIESSKSQMPLNQQELDNFQEDWASVIEFAELELGYLVPSKGEFRASLLILWIRTYYPELSNRQKRQLSGETQQKIWVYPIHECYRELTEAIREFFECDAPSSRLMSDGAFKNDWRLEKLKVV